MPSAGRPIDCGGRELVVLAPPTSDAGPDGSRWRGGTSPAAERDDPPPGASSSSLRATEKGEAGRRWSACDGRGRGGRERREGEPRLRRDQGLHEVTEGRSCSVECSPAEEVERSGRGRHSRLYFFTSKQNNSIGEEQRLFALRPTGGAPPSSQAAPTPRHLTDRASSVVLMRSMIAVLLYRKPTIRVAGRGPGSTTPASPAFEILATTPRAVEDVVVDENHVFAVVHQFLAVNAGERSLLIFTSW